MAVIPFPIPASQPAPVNNVERPAPPKRAQRRQEDETRRMMIAKVKIAQKQLGLDDGTYRDMLRNLFGVQSCTKLNGGQLHKLILHLQDRGWKAKRGSAARGRNRKAIPRSLGSDQQMKKIEALLAEKGRVEGTHMPWEYALGVLRKQTKGEVLALEHADGKQLGGVIAALVRDAQRKGRYVEQWGRDATNYDVQPGVEG